MTARTCLLPLGILFCATSPAYAQAASDPATGGDIIVTATMVNPPRTSSIEAIFKY